MASRQTLIGRRLLPQSLSVEVEPDITLSENEDGSWTARRPLLGVTTQGDTREEALAKLDEAVAGAKEVLEDDSEAAPEPDAPWFESYAWSREIWLVTTCERS